MLITSAKKRRLLRWEGTGEPTECSDLSEFVCFSINDMSSEFYRN